MEISCEFLHLKYARRSCRTAIRKQSGLLESSIFLNMKENKIMIKDLAISHKLISMRQLRSNALMSNMRPMRDLSLNMEDRDTWML